LRCCPRRFGAVFDEEKLLTENLPGYAEYSEIAIA
jgi:hypothetical protein